VGVRGSLWRIFRVDSFLFLFARLRARVRDSEAPADLRWALAAGGGHIHLGKLLFAVVELALQMT